MKAIVCLLLALSVPTAARAEGDAKAGEALFARVCGSCHNLGLHARNGFGPQLNAIFGRRAGDAAGYRYSPAMQASGIVWSQETLSAFIEDPSEVVPGTKMRFWGISDAQKIDDLLAYLRAVR